MADTKITALAVLTAADPINDAIPIVDVSDFSMAASGTTKRISVNNILSSSPTASGALTVTGLVTAGSATISGDLTVDTSTLKVDATNDRVGIGTATPAVPLHVIKDGVASGAGWTAIGRLTNVAATKGVDLGYNPSNNNAVITALSGGTASGFEFWSLDGSWANRATLNSAGLYITNGNLVMSTSGKGIDFSATADGSGTMTSELLNDYEEGTFTPVISGSTTAGVGVYSGQSGKYTKVGNLVTVQIYVNWTAHTGTGNMRVSNLPFTNTSNFFSASVGYLNNITLTAGSVMTAFVEASTSYIVLWQYPTGGGVATEVPIDVSGGIVLSASYTV